MRDLRGEALYYLTPPVGGFWTWSDGGTVVEMRGGGTIAFDAEIAAVLRRLAPEGLPSFSAVLLLLAAARDTWPLYSAHLSNITVVGLAGFDARQDPETKLLQQLDRICAIDAELRSSLRAKAVLAEMIFTGMTQHRDPALAEAVIELLENGLGDVMLEGVALDETDSSSRFTQVFQPSHLFCLVPGLERFDVEDLRLRLETGLDEVPLEAEIELPLADHVRALLTRLKDDDDELAALAGLARNLMAALTLPRPVGERDEMPLGGVSDISNRGPLDRLLLSELAHDDLTLAVRVAVGEALYLRRETPPRTPPRRRTMLLDVGLRSWGVPRVFATAVALALAATADPRVEFAAWRAAGSNVQPVDLATRVGIVEHLAALSTDLHPGASLAAFIERFPDDGGEPLLVTTSDALEDRDFHTQLRAAAQPLMIAAVNREGELTLYEDSPRGRKLVRQVQLDLNALTQRRTKLHKLPAESLLDERLPADLPAILRLDPFPLLLPQQVAVKRGWSVEGRGVFVVAKDRRLLHFTQPEFGGRQFSDALPSSHLVWAEGLERDERTYAVVGSKQAGHLHLLDILLDERRCEVSPLEVEAVPTTCVCSHLGALFVVRERRVDVLEMATGRRLQALEVPRDVMHVRGRVFVAVHGAKYLTLSYDGAAARFEEVLGRQAMRRLRLATMFERRGVDGPIAVTTRGGLFFTATGEHRNVEHEIVGDVLVAAVSRDGQMIALYEKGTSADPAQPFTLVDVDSNQAREFPRISVDRIFEAWLFETVSPRSLRHRLRSVYIDADSGCLTFATRGFPVSLTYEEGARESITLVQTTQRQAALGTLQEFNEFPGRPGAGYRLRAARWPNGDRVVLDARGLLHLVSGDARTPEATLVLGDQGVTVWCNDGRTCGDPYFLGAAPTSTPREVYETVIRPFVEGLA